MSARHFAISHQRAFVGLELKIYEVLPRCFPDLGLGKQ